MPRKSNTEYELVVETGPMFLEQYLWARVTPPVLSDLVRAQLKAVTKEFLTVNPGILEAAYTAQKEAAEQAGVRFSLESALEPVEARLLTYAQEVLAGSITLLEHAFPLYPR